MVQMSKCQFICKWNTFYEGPCLLFKSPLNKSLDDSILKKEEDMRATVFHTPNAC